MTIRLKEINKLESKTNAYEVIYKGDWNDGDYLYEFGVVTEDNFGELVIWLDFFAKGKKLERGYEYDIRTDKYECSINYFKDWLKEKGYTDYDEDLIPDLAEIFVDDMVDLPFESNSGYGIHSLDITLKKDGKEFKLKYDKNDVDEEVKKYLIGNCIISE